MSAPTFKYEHEVGITYNRNFVVRRISDGARWVGKISNSLKEKGVDFRDLDDRAALAHRLAHLLDLPLPRFEIASASCVDGLDLNTSPMRINDTIWLSEYSGVPLPEYLQNAALGAIQNMQDLWHNIAFNVWIGNYDRKDGDYLIDEGGRLSFIDYHLWGPGFYTGDLLALGAYAEAYSLDDPDDTGWCVGTPRLLQHVRDMQIGMALFLPMLARIEALSTREIELSLDGLSFTDQDGRILRPAAVLAYLLTRRSMIRKTLEDWIRAGYPKGERPRDPEHGDNIYRDL